MEDKTIEKVDFSIEELETNYYECTFDKCNFSDSLSEELYSKNVHSKSATFH